MKQSVCLVLEALSSTGGVESRPHRSSMGEQSLLQPSPDGILEIQEEGIFNFVTMFP